MSSDETRIARQATGLGLFDGFSAFTGGIGFVLTKPSVWPYAAVPALMALLLTVVLSCLGVWGAVSLPESWFGEGGWASAGWWTATIVAVAMALMLSTLVGLVLAQPLSGWALEAITVRQEESLTGRRPDGPSLLQATWVSLRCAVFSIVFGGTVLGGLLLIGILIPPALVVTVPLKFLVIGWMVAWDFLDYPLGLRGLGIRRRAVWAAENWWAFTAFGLSWALTLPIPFAVLLVLPMGVAGAARLVVAAEEQER
jgi:CysZ protein